MRYFFAVITCLILSNLYCAGVFADVSYADLFLTGKGYKPCEDDWTIKHIVPCSPDGNSTPDNPRYKEWCIETFHDGEQIYEAYKKIAFDIDYRAEPPKTDYWQTPGETRQSKKGDCEDSVFLFFSRLSELDIDGSIVWGWVIDKGNSIAFAHVWYQLFDKRGRVYIVEGFSKEWNGIVPVEMISGAEERVPTLSLKHSQVNHVADTMIHILDHGRGQIFSESFEFERFDWDIYHHNTTIIKEIFHKLQDMLTRYRG